MGITYFYHSLLIPFANGTERKQDCSMLNPEFVLYRRSKIYPNLPGSLESRPSSLHFFTEYHSSASCQEVHQDEVASLMCYEVQCYSQFFDMLNQSISIFW
jgi:hypothetical protein